MASLKMASSASTMTVRRQLCSSALPRLPVRRVATVVKVQVQDTEAKSASLGPMVALSTAVTTMMASGNALAATELMQLADGDNRASLLLTLFVPALGWVAFNIAGGLFGQLDKMGAVAKDTPPEARSLRVKRSVAGALGLGLAGLLASAPAQASELMQLAESDNRGTLLLTLFVPALGWVAFNIAGGLFNQLDKMGDVAKDTPPEARSVRVKRSVAGALGLGMAGLMASAPAQATELMQLAESDNRASLLLTLFVPALGWVGFNIASGLFGQLDKMGAIAKDTPPAARSVRVKRSVAGALGLGLAGLLASAPAQASELMQLAESDNRGTLLLTLFVPALGWVAFNIAGGLFNQLDKMGDVAKDTPPEARSVRVKRSVAGALGLGMAGLMASAPAQAATEIMQVADSDNRATLLLTLFVPALGWVLFNIAGGLFGQLDKMGEIAKDTPPERRSVRDTRGKRK